MFIVDVLTAKKLSNKAILIKCIGVLIPATFDPTLWAMWKYCPIYIGLRIIALVMLSSITDTQCTAFQLLYRKYDCNPNLILLISRPWPRLLHYYQASVELII